MTTGLKLEAIVLAAGKGERFGGEKLTTEWGDKGPLLHGALAAAFAAPVRHVWVVTGADEKVAEVAKAFAAAHHQSGRLKIIPAAGWELGLAMSLRAGVLAVNSGGVLNPGEAADGAFVFLGDMPRIPHAILQPMADALDDGAFAVAPVCHGERGHPVLFASELFTKLTGLEGDKGAGALLAGLGEGLVTLPAPDDGVLFDVDTRS